MLSNAIFTRCNTSTKNPADHFFKESRSSLYATKDTSSHLHQCVTIFSLFFVSSQVQWMLFLTNSLANKILKLYIKKKQFVKKGIARRDSMCLREFSLSHSFPTWVSTKSPMIHLSSHVVSKTISYLKRELFRKFYFPVSLRSHRAVILNCHKFVEKHVFCIKK